MTRRDGVIPALLCAVALGLAACKRWDNMKYQPRYRPYDPSALFSDGASSRRPPVGTVATDEPIDPVVFEPQPITLDLLTRGQERFNIYCSPCHGYSGDADGPVVQHGFPPPPSFHTDHLRGATDEHIARVIQDGLGKMPPYAVEVRGRDRAAVVAYIRALQLSRTAAISDVPRDALGRLASPTPAPGAPGEGSP